MLTLTRHAEPGEHWDAELAMTHELRCKTRLRTRSVDGEDVALFLPAGSPPLADGDRLQANDGRVARVRALPEPLLHVTAADARELTRAAYHLGNRHVPVQVGEGWLRMAEDSVLHTMLDQLGVSVQAVDAPFQPESGAYGGGHRHADDDDLHDPGHGPHRSIPRIHEFKPR